MSKPIDSHFCCECLNEAIRLFGTPELFKTDQRSQFTCNAFTELLKSFHIQINMDGKCRAIDNVYIVQV
jgi:putative transposase